MAGRTQKVVGRRFVVGNPSVWELTLACGHFKQIPPLVKVEFERAATQQRAKCMECTRIKVAERLERLKTLCN